MSANKIKQYKKSWSAWTAWSLLYSGFINDCAHTFLLASIAKLLSYRKSRAPLYRKSCSLDRSLDVLLPEHFGMLLTMRCGIGIWAPNSIFFCKIFRLIANTQESYPCTNRHSASHRWSIFRSLWHCRSRHFFFFFFLRKRVNSKFSICVL